MSQNAEGRQGTDAATLPSSPLETAHEVLEQARFENKHGSGTLEGCFTLRHAASVQCVPSAAR